MNDYKIREIEKALRLHSQYDSNYSRGRAYLDAMDSLSYNYSGAPGIRLSKMLDDYYEVVGVKNLDEALQRLRDYDKKRKSI